MDEGSGFDFEAAVLAPFRMQPGLQRLAPQARVLTALSPRSEVFGEKLAVLQRDAGAALLCTKGFDPLPAWHALAQAAAGECPAALTVTPEAVQAPLLGWQVRWDGRDVMRLEGTAATEASGSPLPSLASPAPLSWVQACQPNSHPPTGDACELDAAVGACLSALPVPLRVAGLLSLALHQDFAIVDGADASLPALAVCLPSHWAPEDKIGRSFAAVHGPVADNAVLIAASRHLMQLVCQAQRWERFVWNLTPQTTHDQHPRRRPAIDWPQTGEGVISAARWRTERQTFLPLPERQQAVFTIHVEVQPLAEAIDSPRRAAVLHAALGSMSEAVLDYRGLARARGPLLDWLADRAGAAIGGHHPPL